MDSYGFVDSVKEEKANALASYRRFTNIARLFQLIEVFVAVVLISWSSTRLPLVLKLSGEYLFAFSSCLLNQHVVFLVGNVIVVVCYVLSRDTDAGNESGGSGVYCDDDKYSSLDRQKTTTAGAPDAKSVRSRGTVPPITKETAGAESKNRTIEDEKAIIKKESEVAAETAIKQAAKQIERFQRTQSEKLKSQISMKRRRELRRSVTETSSSMVVVSGDEVSSEAVDRLSNEEFRIAVEAFISKQQSFLKQQNMVDNGS